MGHSKRLGNYIVLQDSYGNRFIYAQLGSLAKAYPVPKQRKLTAADFRLVRPGHDSAPRAPASAGISTPAPAAAATPLAAKKAGGAKTSVKKVIGKGSNQADAGGANATVDPAATRAERAAARPGPKNTENLRPRLYALPQRTHNAKRSGVTGKLGDLLKHRMLGYHSVKAYLGNVLHFDSRTMHLQPLHVGARVPGGTVLGRIGATAGSAPHVNFSIRPTGAGAPKIDPKPILDGWKLLEDTSIYRAAGKDPFNPHASMTQALLASKQQLERQVLADPRLEIYQCGRDDIQTGQIDQRVLSGLEYLADNGYRLSITALKCGSSSKTLAKAGARKGDATGSSVDISAIDGVPVAGHDGSGSLTASLVKTSLQLQGVMTPQEVISPDNLAGPVSFSLPDYSDRVHIGFLPLSGSGYQFPFLSYAWGRTDMGVDFTGTGPILAVGNARILATGASGWPNGGAGPSGQGVLYKLLDGPKAGHIVYVYEGVVPTVKAGDTVVAGQRIATFYDGSSIEIGWADAAGRPLAAPVYSEGDVTKWGSDFRDFLTGLGGGPGKVNRQFNQLLRPGQWKKLIGRIGSLHQPSVATEPSKYAVRTGHNGSLKSATHH
jgi:murein DD-endopeptidase MepM/ murein hydrolase activator NlpD